MTDTFVHLANEVAAGRGLDGLPLTIIPHPLADLTPAEIQERAEQALPNVVRTLTDPALARPRTQPATIDSPTDGILRIQSDASDVEACFDEFVRNGWTDGLPIVPPTPGRTDRMLGKWAGDAALSLGSMPPRRRATTLRSIAANCVMAGCRPEDFPVVVAAIKAMLDPAFNLLGVQDTTHPAAPLVIVNGPIRPRLGINSGHGCFGPAWRANATIGRALRLVLLNVGGAKPGKEDKSTQGGPAKYSFCIGENEEASPWEPLHVERGYDRAQSTVTVVAAEAPHNVHDPGNSTAKGILGTTVSAAIPIAGNDCYLGIGRHHPVVAYCPEHARTISGDGFEKRDIKQYLFEQARNPLWQLKRGGMYPNRDWPPGFEPTDEDARLPIVQQPDDFIVIVAGGAGKHSSFIPSFGLTSSITIAIEEK